MKKNISNHLLFLENYLYLCTRFAGRSQAAPQQRTSSLRSVFTNFAAAYEQKWAVLYGQLPRNPPGWEHSKGTWL